MATKKKKQRKISNNKPSWICSGYGVAPSGEKCKGCIDCNWGKGVKSMAQIKHEISSRVVRVNKNDTGDDILGRLFNQMAGKTKKKK